MWCEREARSPYLFLYLPGTGGIFTSRIADQRAHLPAQRGALRNRQPREQTRFGLDLPRGQAGELLDLADQVRLVVEAAFDPVVDLLALRHHRHRRAQRAILARQQLGRGAVQRVALALDLAARQPGRGDQIVHLGRWAAGQPVVDLTDEAHGASVAAAYQFADQRFADREARIDVGRV